MPSGPKKRKAARRRKLKEEEERHQQQHNGNGSDGETGSDSLVDEDDLSSSAATTPTPTCQQQQQPPNLDLDINPQHHGKDKQINVEDWVRQSDFDVGTPPPQTPSLALEEADDFPYIYHNDQEERFQELKTAQGEPATSLEQHPPVEDDKCPVTIKDHPSAAQSHAGDELHKPQKLPETASWCCGILDWLLGRTT